MLETAGADRVVSSDLHASQIAGFFNIPVDDVSPIILFAIRHAPQFYRTVEDLAREFAISKRTLFYLFKKRMNISPVKCLIAERLEKSRWYLLHRSYTVTAAAELCGYNSAAYFSREFKRAYGFSPQEYRQNYVRTGRDLLMKKREEGLPVSGGRGTRTDPPPSPRR